MRKLDVRNLNIAVDESGPGIIVIEGVKYSFDLFKELRLAELNKPFIISERTEDGVLVFNKYTYDNPTKESVERIA